MFTYLLFRNKVIFVKWESVLIHRSGHVLTWDLVRYIHERLQFSLQFISLAWTITEREIVESIKLRHKLGSYTIEEFGSLIQTYSIISSIHLRIIRTILAYRRKNCSAWKTKENQISSLLSDGLYAQNISTNDLSSSFLDTHSFYFLF